MTKEPVFTLVDDQKPKANLRFYNNQNCAGKPVGEFDFTGPRMTFTGDAEASALIFIDCVAAKWEFRLAEERKAGQEDMRQEIAEARPVMRSYAVHNPKYLHEGREQDPLGVHAWLERNDK